MKNLLRLIIVAAFLTSSFNMDAQKNRRYERRHNKGHERIEKDNREGKLSIEEQQKIADKEKKLHRTSRKALRNGHVSGHEQNKMDRRLRHVKRETRRSEKH